MILPNVYRQLLKITKPTLVMVKYDDEPYYKFRVIRPSGFVTYRAINGFVIERLQYGYYHDDELKAKNNEVFTKPSCYYKRRMSLKQVVQAMNDYDAGEKCFITIIGEV